MPHIYACNRAPVRAALLAVLVAAALPWGGARAEETPPTASVESSMPVAPAAPETAAPAAETTAPAAPAATAAAAAPARAEPAVTGTRPERGALMTEIEARYGAPTNRQAPVGQPPITRWDYPGLVVYFENERLIHAVLVRQD
jgi:hypothetical protein